MGNFNVLLTTSISVVICFLALFAVELFNLHNIKDKKSRDYITSLSAVWTYVKVLGALLLSVVMIYVIRLISNS